MSVKFSPNDLRFVDGGYLYIFAIDCDGNLHQTGYFYRPNDSLSSYDVLSYNYMAFHRAFVDYASQYPVVVVLQSPNNIADIPQPIVPPPDFTEEEWKENEEEWERFDKHLSRKYKKAKQKLFNFLSHLYSVYKRKKMILKEGEEKKIIIYRAKMEKNGDIKIIC